MERNLLHHVLSAQWGEARYLSNAVSRTMEIQGDLSKQEVSIITGVRRCGKSSYLRQLAVSLSGNFAPILVEFDDPNLEGFRGQDFSQLISIWEELNPGDNRARIFLLDEIQNVEGWEKWVTQLAKDRSNKIIVTGSNSKMLSSELGTLLTGRHITHEMTPFSFSEVCNAFRREPRLHQSEENVAEQVYKLYSKFGGFPRAYVEKDTSVLPRYLADFLERDVIARHGARLSRPLKELIRVCCSSNTRLVNRSKIAKELGIKDDATVKRYMNWFAECYVFFEVKQFFASVRKQMRSQSKLYFIDPALAQQSTFSVMGTEGAFLENSVYLELRRRGYEIFYWKSEKSDSEVDFVARKAGNDLQAVQVSLTVVDEKTLDRELRGLSNISRELGIKDLLLITLADKERSIKFNGCDIRFVSFLNWAQ